MTTQSRIIKETRELMTRIGVSAMTMDMVARNCGISKRTLYETFPDKKTLVKTCMAESHRERDRQLNEIFHSASNCYDALFKTYLYIRKYMDNTSLVFVTDIKRLYPDLFLERREKEKNLVSGLSKILSQAQVEGYVEKSIDTQIAAFLFLNNMRDISENRRHEDFGFQAIDVFDAAFLNFLRGISTIEGIKTIEAYYQDNNQKQL
ncbi:MAG: TetR/AcrR family transcriptional regulator [Muribaculaceae bacterium]|nr:TetR/AcrR family transcriptional regulator [Muribaculaceae bacterium]